MQMVGVQMGDQDHVGDRGIAAAGTSPRRRRRCAKRRANSGSVRTRTPESSIVQVA